MGFEKWFEQYAPTAPECLDECAKAAWKAGFESGATYFHEAVKIEREECAKVCEKQYVDAIGSGCEEDFAFNTALEKAAAEIRARSNTL